MPDVFLQSGEANPSDVRLRDVAFQFAWSATFSNAIVINAEVAIGTGAASAAAVTDAPTLVVVAGSGAAADAGSLVKPAAVLATGTGAVAVAAGSVKPSAGATGIGAAQNATVTTASVTNASAGLASGTGAAADAVVSTWNDWSATYSNTVAASATNVDAGLASGTGAANNATRDVVWGDWSTTYSNAVAGAQIRAVGGRSIQLLPNPDITYVHAGVATGTGSAPGVDVISTHDDALVLILAA